MLKVALTGNMGMGKSTVLRLMKEMGAATLDSDAIVSGLLSLPEVLQKISGLLGPEVIDPATGRLDRKKVATLVFSDEKLRKEYEALIHPMVYTHIEKSLAEMSADLIVVEIPLLFETGHETDFDATVTVRSDEDIALGRMEQAGWSRAEAQQRMKIQMPIEEKVKRATYTVDNSDNIESTRAQVEHIMKELRQA